MPTEIASRIRLVSFGARGRLRPLSEPLIHNLMETNPAVYYRVWGIDNVAYGPVELPTLVTWIRTGRVLQDSWVFSDASGGWKHAGEVSELKSLFKSKDSSGAPAAKALHGITPGTLRRIRILADMDDRQLASFLDYMEVLKYLPNATVCQKGEQGDAMFLVLEGELRARVMIDNRESTLATMGVGECFGELAVIDESTRSADVISNSDSVVLKISAGALRNLFTEAPALAAPFLLGLSRTLAGRIRHLTKRFEDSVHFARTAQGQ